MSENNHNMEKRYGLPTAVAMVIGTVMGSGIFIKGGKVLDSVGGHIGLAVLVVFAVGLICIICSLVFAELSAKYGKASGVVDYAEMALGRKYAYYVGWFLNTVYYPSLTTILAFFSAMFTCPLLGIEVLSFETGTIAMEAVGLGAAYLMIGFAINALSPRLAGKLQVSMTVIKLIPLLAMGIIGTAVGLVRGTTIDVVEFSAGVPFSSSGVFGAIVAFAFSYEGWIIATSIQGELKNAKRNMPIALVGGALVCTVIYSLYLFSLSAVGDVDAIIATWPLGEHLPRLAFSSVFGRIGGTLVYVFIAISCLGTMNGLIMGCCRGMHAVSSRGMGPMPEFFSDVDKDNGFVIKSSLVGLLLCGFWYGWTVIMWMQGPDFFGGVHSSQWFGWEPDEISIVTLYTFYIPMFIALMVKCRELSVTKRFILPSLGVMACLFMLYCCIHSKGYKQVIGYLLFFATVMLIGGALEFYRSRREHLSKLDGKAL